MVMVFSRKARIPASIWSGDMAPSPVTTRAYISVSSLAAQLAGLTRRGDDAELLHHPQGVPLDPLLDDPATGDPVDVDCRHFCRPAGRGNAHELAPMGTPRCPAAHHLVPLRD